MTTGPLTAGDFIAVGIFITIIFVASWFGDWLGHHLPLDDEGGDE